ncbi:MAG: phosphopantetheine-binding protein [Bacillota bacterium]|nr:phosphopantetheine-binding protein [Bacillota bacterium]
MTVKEKLNMLEDLLDIERDSLNEDLGLDEVENWDSMAVIALIAMFDESFEKVLTPAEVKKFKTIKDIVDQME